MNNRTGLWVFLFGLAMGLLSLTISTSCATIGAPEGGERDTIPPQILTTFPENLGTAYSLAGEPLFDYAGKQIEITFDEYYVLRNPSSQIYLSPPTDGELDIQQKGKKLRIRLPDSLQAATTYTLNFGASLTDLTEGNVQQRFKYVFSTGSFIDSFFVEGHVTDGYTAEKVRDLTVMLYGVDDSSTLALDSIPMTQRPSYFGVTDDKGHFLIDFVKSGRYLVFAFEDKNNDLLYNPGIEIMGFVPELVTADSLPVVSLSMSKEWLAPELRNAQHQAWGKIRFPFSAPVKNLQWQGPLFPDSAFQQAILQTASRSDTFDLYFDHYSLDSLVFLLTVNDSIQDTALVMMRSYDPPAFTWRLSASPYLHPGDSLKLQSSRPFRLLDPNLTIVRNTDTVRFRPDQVNDFRFSHDLGLRYEAPISCQLIIYPGQLEVLGGEKNADTLVMEWKTLGEEDYAVLLLQVEANWTAPLLFELLNERNKVLRRFAFTGSLKERLPYMEPGRYKARLLEDLDGDQEWSPGNWLERKQAERMFFYDEMITLKANWDVESVWRVRTEDYGLRKKETKAEE